MESEILEKIKKLSPELKAKLESDDFLAKLDELDATYGVKGILILLQLVLAELNYEGLSGYLSREYGFNEFVAEKVKLAFGELIKILGSLPKTDSNRTAVNPLASQATPKMPAQSHMVSNFSAMTFSREDEEEIKKLKGLNYSSASVDYFVLADQIIASLDFKTLDAVLLKRLQNIIVSRLKDVRDELETKEILIKGQKVGGLELSTEEAETVLKVIKNFNTHDYNNSPLTPILSQSMAATPQVESSDNLPALTPEHELLVIEDDDDGLPVIKLPQDREAVKNLVPPILKSATKTVTQPVPNLAEPKKLSKAGQNVKITTDEQPVEQPVSKKFPAPQPAPFLADRKIPESVLTSRSSQRPNLDGVKFEKKLAGPIEELAEMTLIDFRRIAADPKTAVNKIQEKINLLSEESFQKRVDGITAWHNNEVNKFYRLLGQASMSDGKPIEEVIKERLFANKPTLSIDEFYAIMELNKFLRY